MKKLNLFFLTFLVLTSYCSVNAQSTYNFNVLNYNGLLINPAYAGSVGTTSFQAAYSGLVGAIGSALAPQYYDFTLHAPLAANPQIGVGGIIEVYKFGALTELELRPSFSIAKPVGELGELRIGGQLNISYFTFNDGNNGFLPQNVLATGVGLGIFYHQEHFFAGLSAPAVVQFATTPDDTPELLGERPILFHTGYWAQATQFIKIKIAALAGYTQFYQFPLPANGTFRNQTEGGLNINAIFSDRYWFGVGFGRVKNDDANPLATYNYLNVSAVYTFNIARLGYSYQTLLGRQATSATTRHTILLEFDLKDEGREKVIRYF